MEKIVIDEKSLAHIREYGHRYFLEQRSFGPLDNGQIQCLLIVQGLRDYLQGQGIEPCFDLKVKTK